MDCISSSSQIALNQDQKQSPAPGTHSAPAQGQPGLGTALLGWPQGRELTPSAARGSREVVIPFCHSPHLDAASKGVNRGGQVPQRPPKQLGAGATAAALDIFEDQMRFLRTRKPPTVFPLSFLPLHFVTDKGEGKPKLSFSKAIYLYVYICLHTRIYIYFNLAQKKGA